ncbi:MAG: hypothetical protein M1817_000979 [Caeruleum heppii]|nr:MAG: hypothetical protein M1817_000979 [Caeruleum heppii]
MRCSSLRLAPLALLLGALPAAVRAGDILKASGVTSCIDNADIKIDRIDLEYDSENKKVIFDVAGSSAQEQNVTASLTVTAYGNEVYRKDFDPCDDETKVKELCPVPAGSFGAKGQHDIPAQYADMIPSIAFQLPDLDGQAKLELKGVDGGQNLACVESAVNNGKSIQTKAISYMAIGIAGATLALSGVSALSAAGTTGATTSSPSFGQVMGWFQSMAMNGMLSVNYPPVYRAFTKNFAFSGGLVPWTQMQTSIDSFRGVTGGNLTDQSVAALRNATLVHTDGSTNATSLRKRGIELLYEGSLLARQVITNVNGSDSSLEAANGTAANGTKTERIVHGVQGYVEQLMIPQANTFMTVLLVFAIVIAAIAVGILLFKVILEFWAMFGSFPKSLTGFRKRYWGLLARTIVNLILILYGVWTLYCVFQFTHGDSWAAKTLAGVTFAIFTAILGVFTFRIWQLARRYRKTEGDTSALFEDKQTWRRYSLFYDQYKKNLWWIFVPAIIYMFAKGCIIAAGDGHGLVQTGGQLIVEALMLALLVWHRPYVTKAGNWINIFIQVVRVLSVVCILVFVEQLGIAQSTKTVTGVVLIAVQSVLTAALAILIAVNAIIICFRENPHRKKRKEAGTSIRSRQTLVLANNPAAEKLNRDLDNLTPLDARNSLLMDPSTFHASPNKGPMVSEHPLQPPFGSNAKAPLGYRPVATRRDSTPMGRPRFGSRDSTDHLVTSAASMGGHRHERSLSPPSISPYGSPPPASRQPTLPNVGAANGGGAGYRGFAF